MRAGRHDASTREISTPEGCKEGSQVWSAKRDTPGSQSLARLCALKARKEFPAALQAAPPGKTNQGLRSFHSLTPGYLPCTPPACKTAVSSIALVSLAYKLDALNAKDLPGCFNPGRSERDSRQRLVRSRHGIFVELLSPLCG